VLAEGSITAVFGVGQRIMSTPDLLNPRIEGAVEAVALLEAVLVSLRRGTETWLVKAGRSQEPEVHDLYPSS